MINMKQYKVKVGHEVTYWEVDEYVIKAKNKKHLKELLKDIWNPNNQKHIINNDMATNSDHIENGPYHTDNFNMYCKEIKNV